MITHAPESKPRAQVTLPASWYVEPSHWPIERQSIFADNWQFFGHDSEIPQPRAWRADILSGFPVVVVRSDDGQLKAFHNVCRHRAGPLVRETSGVCDGHLTCAYHGWKYTLDGRLRAARDFGVASDFDPRDYGLFPLKLSVWRGLIFIGIGANLPDLQDLMNPLDQRLGDSDWTKLKVGLRRQHTLQCNWKTYVENYLEGYHVPAMHPSLDAEIVADQYKVTVEGRVALHDVPARSQEAVYDGLWAWVWPNIGVNVYNRGLMIERMSPIQHTTTQLDYLYLMPDGEPVPEATLIMSDQVTAEDLWITERVQENLNAGVYQTGRLSPKHEEAVFAFQQWVREKREK